MLEKTTLSLMNVNKFWGTLSSNFSLFQNVQVKTSSLNTKRGKKSWVTLSFQDYTL